MHNPAISTGFVFRTFGLVLIGCLIVAGCQNKPKRPAPSAPPPSTDPGPKTEPTMTGSNTPDTTLNIEVKRVNADSWWKVCIETWVVEFPKSRVSIGCNTDADLASKRIEIPGSSKQCNTIALSMTVFRNTVPCTSNASSCEHEATPMHARSTSTALDVDFFRAAYRSQLTWPFSRDDLKVIAIPEAEQSQYAASATGGAAATASGPVVVFFEDQTDANHMAWKNGGDARTKGIDYFDAVVEFSATNAPFTIEGQPAISCVPAP
jgi:hypothetical protein